MKITWNELTVAFDPDGEDLLESWRWKIGKTARPILITALGDAFLQEKDGSVWWLDTGGGQYVKISDSSGNLQQLLVQNADEWFMPQLVGDLLTSGMTLAPDQCFSFKTPPVLSGLYEVSNFEPADISVHFHLLGEIHQQVKDLPPGTRIDSIEIKGPEDEQ